MKKKIATKRRSVASELGQEYDFWDSPKASAEEVRLVGRGIAG